MRVLVVEDEPDLAEAIARGLRRDAIAVDVVTDGEAAVEQATVERYDVIILDRHLPLLHGDAVCAELLSTGVDSRILMLTAAASVGDRIDGLDLGADDYLGKPFDFGELKARVRALARRQGRSQQPILRRNGLVLDPAMHRVERDGQEVSLTRKEFAVLEALMRADGAAVSSEELLRCAWNEEINPFTNAVRITVSRLRRTLGEPPLIETVAGIGYRL